MKIRNIALLAIPLALVACEPTPLPQAAATPTEEAIPTEIDSTPEATDAAAEPIVPEAVKHFDALCYRTNANYDQIRRVAGAMKLQEAPADLQELMASGRASEGTAYVIELDRAAPKMIIVGAGKNGTCSIYAGGYDSDAIEASMKQQFKLLQIADDEVGLQRMTMHIPNGQANLISETHQNGVITILRSKPEAGNGEEVMIGFVPPELAKATSQ